MPGRPTAPAPSRDRTAHTPTETAFLVSHANLGHVIRLLRAGNVVPRVGQKLTIWIEGGPAAGDH